jgi:hypothetical protein
MRSSGEQYDGRRAFISEHRLRLGGLFNEASHDQGLNEWAKAKEGWIHALAVLVPGVDLQPSPVESLSIDHDQVAHPLYGPACPAPTHT